MLTRIAVPGDAREIARLISLAYRVEDFFKIGDRTNEADVRARIEKSAFLLLEDNASMLLGCVYVDIRGRDLRSAVLEMQQAVAKNVEMGAGYSISWSGQFEYLERATARLMTDD